MTEVPLLPYDVLVSKQIAQGPIEHVKTDVQLDRAEAAQRSRGRKGKGQGKGEDAEGPGASRGGRGGRGRGRGRGQKKRRGSAEEDSSEMGSPSD